MKILAIDTSTPTASIAVMQGDKPLAETAFESGKKQGERLVPAIENLMAGIGISPADICAYAVGIGPGSFTGLRSGLSLIKGMALARPGPVVGISSLHAIAAASDFKGVVLPVIDARKGQVFTAIFRADNEGALVRESDDMAIAPERVADLTAGPALVLGNGLTQYRSIIEKAMGETAVIGPQELWTPKAAKIGALAWERLEPGDSDPLDTLVPKYVRSSDAELKLGKKR